MPLKFLLLEAKIPCSFSYCSQAMGSKLLTICTALLMVNLGFSSEPNWVFYFYIKADIYFPTYTTNFWSP